MSEEENLEILIDTQIPEDYFAEDEIDEGSVEKFEDFDPEQDDK